MYLHLGQSVVVPHRDVIGIFDLDNATSSHVTRSFLEQAEKEGRAVSVSEELPKSFVVCRPTRGVGRKRTGPDRVFISQLSSATLKGRAENNLFE